MEQWNKQRYIYQATRQATMGWHCKPKTPPVNLAAIAKNGNKVDARSSIHHQATMVAREASANTSILLAKERAKKEKAREAKATRSGMWKIWLSQKMLIDRFSITKPINRETYRCSSGTATNTNNNRNTLLTRLTRQNCKTWQKQNGRAM